MMPPGLPPVQVPPEIKAVTKALKIEAKRPSPDRIEIKVYVKEDMIDTAFKEFSKIMKQKGKEVSREKFDKVMREDAVRILVDSIRDSIFYTTNAMGVEVDYTPYEGEYEQ